MSWFWFDLPAMKPRPQCPTPPPFYIEAGPAPNPGGFPIGGQTIFQLPSDHLQYAITWFALAVALAVIYFVLQRAPKSNDSLSQPRNLIRGPA